MRLPRGLLEAGVEKYLPCLVRGMTLLWSCMDQAGPKLQVVADLADVSEALQGMWRRSRART